MGMAFMPIDYKKEVRLKMNGVSNRRIAELLHTSRNGVIRCIKIIQSFNLSYSEILTINETVLKNFLNNRSDSGKDESNSILNYPQLTKGLARSCVAMQLLWEEYTNSHRLQKKQGYCLTQFKKNFNDHLSTQEFTLVIHHKTEEKVEIE